MSKTIKQLAEELNVSKTAIRKRFNDEFRANYVQTTENGMILISENGCKLIAETIQTNAIQFPQPTENPVSSEEQPLLTVLQEQLTIKDEQLNRKDNQISELQNQISELTLIIKTQAENIQTQQALTAGTIQLKLEQKKKILIIKNLQIRKHTGGGEIIKPKLLFKKFPCKMIYLTREFQIKIVIFIFTLNLIFICYLFHAFN